MLAVLKTRILNYFLDVAALAVFYKHMWVLIGTAAGLVGMLALTIITEYGRGRRAPHR